MVQMTDPLTELTKKETPRRARAPAARCNESLHRAKRLPGLQTGCQLPLKALPLQTHLKSPAQIRTQSLEGSVPYYTKPTKTGHTEYSPMPAGSSQSINYSPYLLELQATIWGMDHHAPYLKGCPFSLFKDHHPVEKLGKVHMKTLYWLQEVMQAYDIDVKLRQDDDLPADCSSNTIVQAISWEPKQLQAAQEASLLIKHLERFLTNRSCPKTSNFNIISGCTKKTLSLKMASSGVESSDLRSPGEWHSFYPSPWYLPSWRKPMAPFSPDMMVYTKPKRGPPNVTTGPTWMPTSRPSSTVAISARCTRSLHPSHLTSSPVCPDH
jgi:hypothetical protein